MSYTNAIISSSDPVSKPSQQPSPIAPSKAVQSATATVTPATTASVTVSLTPTTGSTSTSVVTVMSKSTNAVPLAQSKPQQEPSVPHHPVAIVSPMVSSAPLPHQPQIKPQVDASEYSLFDSFSKVHT